MEWRAIQGIVVSGMMVAIDGVGDAVVSAAFNAVVSAALQDVIKQQRDRIAVLESVLHEAGLTFAFADEPEPPKHAPFPARALRFGWAR